MIRTDERPPVNGRGTFVHTNSFFTYTGDWKNGVKHGNGILIMRDGSSYEGQFLNGEITGKGVKRWPSGSTYSGEFQDGEINGEGSYVGSDGERFTGHFVNNRREGQGELQTEDGTVFKGGFQNNHINGRGVKTLPDNSSISTTFENGQIVAGNGRWTYPDGTEYEGEVLALTGERHGTGLYVDHNTNIVYTGTWKNDDREEYPTHIKAVFSDNTADIDTFIEQPLSKRKIIKQEMGTVSDDALDQLQQDPDVERLTIDTSVNDLPPMIPFSTLKFRAFLAVPEQTEGDKPPTTFKHIKSEYGRKLTSCLYLIKLSPKIAIPPPTPISVTPTAATAKKGGKQVKEVTSPKKSVTPASVVQQPPPEEELNISLDEIPESAKQVSFSLQDPNQVLEQNENADESVQVELFAIDYVEATIDEDTQTADFAEVFIPSLEPGIYGLWFSDHSNAMDIVSPYMLIFEIVKPVI
jgi:hypothetical protein